jgi:Tfp pilus assembly PilM family ATPase
MGRVAADGLAENPGLMDELLSELSASLRIKKAKVITCISRSEVDEFEATLPPAADEELGFLVANEAHKHHPATDDDARVDFLTIEQNPDQTRRVSIVVMPDDQHRPFAERCERQGWKLSSIQLRHVATTRLLAKLLDLGSHKQSILLSLSRTDADLVILQQGQIALVRTIPLANESDVAALVEKLAVEIQRSLMITTKPDHQDELGQTQMYFFGRAEEQESLRDQLAQALNMPVQLLDPLTPFAISRRKIPNHVHQFAGLLGSLLDQSAAQMIDLHTPKCAKKASAWRTRAIVYGIGAVVMVAALFGWVMNNVSQARLNTARLKAELARIQKQHDELEAKLAVVDYYQNDWRRDDVDWLDELRELSQDFPERSKIQVKSMTLSAGTNGDGIIAMNLRAKDNAAIAALENNVRDDFHQIRINQLSQNESDKEFPWQFGATVLVRRRDRDEYSPAPVAANIGQPEKPAEALATAPNAGSSQ